MNKIIIGIFLLIIISSCKKDNPEPQVIVTSNSQQRIAGVVSPGVTFNTLTLFPNPASKAYGVYINYQAADTTGNCNISVLAGKYSETVYSQKLTSKNKTGSVTLNLQNFPQGVVLVQVILNSQMWEYNLIID